MTRVEFTELARQDLDSLIRTRELPPNVYDRLRRSLEPLGGGFDTEVAGHPGVRAPWAYTDASMPAGGMTQWFVQLNRVDPNGGRTQFKVQTYAICAFVAG